MNARRLPVLATVLRGWWLLARDWWILLRIIALPLAILVALDFYLAALWQRRLESPAYTNPEYADSAMNHLMNLDMALAIVLGGLIVALWHRVRLAGRQTLSLFRLLAAWRNVLALSVHWCGLVLVTLGLIWVVGSPLGRSASERLSKVLIKEFGLISHPALYRVLMDLILDAGPLLVALHVSGRLGLMLWSRPAGGEGALDRAWAAGDGNGWRLAAAIFLAILPIALIESALPPMLGAAVGVQYIFVRHDIANLLQLIVAVAVLAAAHAALLGKKKATETPAPADATSL